MRILTSAALLLSATGLHAQDAEPDPLQTRVLDEYAMLEGEWVLDQANLTGEMREAQASQGILASGITFTYGTDRQWMAFDDWRELAGGRKATGIGLLAFSPREQQVIFTEHGARGAAVHGTLEKTGERTFLRSISVSRTDTAWRQRDEWTFDADGRCFEWQAAYSRNGEDRAGPATRYCRAD